MYVTKNILGSKNLVLENGTSETHKEQIWTFWDMLEGRALFWKTIGFTWLGDSEKAFALYWEIADLCKELH